MRRFAHDEVLCLRRTFAEVSDQVPTWARVRTRLPAAVLDAVVSAGRVVAEVTAAHRVAWWTMQRIVDAAADVLGDPDEHPARRLGIHEHRDRTVRWHRAPLETRREPGTATSRG